MKSSRSTLLILAWLLLQGCGHKMHYAFQLTNPEAITTCHIVLSELDIITQPSTKSIFFKIKNISTNERLIHIEESYIIEEGYKVFVRDHDRNKKIKLMPSEIKIFRLYRKDLKDIFQDRGLNTAATEKNILSNLGEPLKFILVVDGSPIDLNYEVTHIVKHGYAF